MIVVYRRERLAGCGPVKPPNLSPVWWCGGAPEASECSIAVSCVNVSPLPLYCFITVCRMNNRGTTSAALEFERAPQIGFYPSRYIRDTCRIHHDTPGYVSDRGPPPNTIGTPPPAPGGGSVWRVINEPPPAKGEFASRPMVARLVRYRKRLAFLYIVFTALSEASHEVGQNAPMPTVCEPGEVRLVPETADRTCGKRTIPWYARHRRCPLREHDPKGESSLRVAATTSACMHAPSLDAADALLNQHDAMSTRAKETASRALLSVTLGVPEPCRHLFITFT
jgi:hypothetical protein